MNRTSTSLADMIRRDVLNVVPLNDDIETSLNETMEHKQVKKFSSPPLRRMETTWKEMKSPLTARGDSFFG